MSKRSREADNESRRDGIRLAMELVCQRPATAAELSSVTLTPLERQVVALKSSIPDDVLLMVACGYRVKFFGRDSRVASRRLGIMCIPTAPFESSSVPYTRVNLYVHRLVAMGYRVAFADQESASLRAASGTGKGIFTRTISRIYSRGTLLPSEVIGCDHTNTSTNPTNGSDAEAETESDPVDPAEGTSASFSEGSERFLCFLRPPSPRAAEVEAVLVSFVTNRALSAHLRASPALTDLLHRHDVVEVAVLGGPLSEPFHAALADALPLHAGPSANGGEDQTDVTCTSAPGMASVSAAAAAFLQPCGLDAVFAAMRGETGTRREERTCMELPGATLRALDVFRSGIGPRGTLLALMDHCYTAAGGRRLRRRLAAPPCQLAEVRRRQAAVTQLMSCRKPDRSDRKGDARRGSGDPTEASGAALSCVDVVSALLREWGRNGDAEATMAKLQAGRCTVAEFTQLLRTLQSAHARAKATTTAQHDEHVAHVKTEKENDHDKLLKKEEEEEEEEEQTDLVEVLLRRIASSDVAAVLDACRVELNASATSPLELFTAPDAIWPSELASHAADHAAVRRDLDKELERIQGVLKLPGLSYRTIAGTSFVLDVPRAQSEGAPGDWIVLSRTRTHVRFHTPTILERSVSLCAAQERMALAAAAAWTARQSVLSHTMAAPVSRALEALAELDVLFALSRLSASPGYTAPALIPAEGAAGDTCVVVGGRHPVLERIASGGCVACDVRLARGGAWLLTGPNMGGKSALMRMLGTFAILAQLGCHVPAVEARLPVFGAVFARMGASDGMLEGASTFLAEMEETSRILRSPRLPAALVLLDELGRGTSSFDGVAVAAATLEFLIQRRATTVFVTHYTHLCEPYQHGTHADVACYFMGFREEQETAKDEPRLCFTYKPTRGVTPSSFGVRVARMAGLPTSVVEEAQRISEGEAKSHAARTALAQLRQIVTLPTA